MRRGESLSVTDTDWPRLEQLVLVYGWLQWSSDLIPGVKFSKQINKQIMENWRSRLFFGHFYLSLFLDSFLICYNSVAGLTSSTSLNSTPMKTPEKRVNWSESNSKYIKSFFRSQIKENSKVSSTKIRDFIRAHQPKELDHLSTPVKEKKNSQQS